MNDIRLPLRDRRQAGRLLAGRLAHLRSRRDVVVLALPRGGVPVGFEVAHALGVPLDVFVVRKLGFPGHEEYAMGAIATGGVRVMNPDAPAVTDRELAEVVAREQKELVRRERLYRGDRPALALDGRVVVLVDDGLATGATMRAAVAAIRLQRPARIVVAVPVGAAETCAVLRAEADEVVCPAMPQPFRAVGLWYEEFPQTTDEEVHELLGLAQREHALQAH